jgi:hypothetical protein
MEDGEETAADANEEDEFTLLLMTTRCSMTSASAFEVLAELA